MELSPFNLDFHDDNEPKFTKPKVRIKSLKVLKQSVFSSFEGQLAMIIRVLWSIKVACKIVYSP